MKEEVQRQIVRDLRVLGLRKGGIVLVHSSLRSLGVVSGGAETLVSALLDTVGKSGTLLLPALSYASVGAHNPVFDRVQTPSCVGALTEFFRTRPGTIRSIHPTHSVCAFGVNAEELCRNHHLDTTPCGAHSPFSRLRELGGQVLFLGCGLKPNTSMHAIEEQVVPPYLFGEPVDYRIILEHKRDIAMRVTSHNFSGWEQRYDRLSQLLDEHGLKQGKVLEADASLIDGKKMWEQALAALQKDPLFFVEETR
ncbi:MAG: AAC(3) family N-acetyltransferase [bacterium]|nr:AAC(3) family N-acetyltransferase [bacterium]